MSNRPEAVLREAAVSALSPRNVDMRRHSRSRQFAVASSQLLVYRTTLRDHTLERLTRGARDASGG